MAITTFADILLLPPRIKALIVVGTCLLLGYAFWFFYLGEAWEKKTRLTASVSELKERIAAQERIIAQRDKHASELKTIKEQFRLALIKLPERKEIPGLLRSVALIGRQVGLEFVHFEPIAPPPPDPKEKKAAEGKKDAKAIEEPFYEVIPIKMTVRGSYHRTVAFFDRVARLPRIINFENILSEVQEKKDKGVFINTAGILKTYMFKEVREKEKGR